MNQAVFVFDLDGTLLDARARQVQVLVAACHALGEPAPDVVGFWHLKRDGNTTREALERLGVLKPVAQQLSAWWVAHVEDADMLGFDELQPRACDAIAACRLNGLSPRILTARRDSRLVQLQIETSGLGTLVDDVCVVAPRLAVTEKAVHLKRWQAIAMIGDTESDARAAALAMVPFLAVSCGQRSETYLRSQSLRVFEDVQSAVRYWFSERNSYG